MRDPMEVLRSKEQEIQRVRREIEALRMVAPMLEDSRDRNAPPPGSNGSREEYS